DSKITTVVAMLSADLINVARDILKRDQTYQRFFNITEFEWSRVFGSKPLLGEDLQWSLPSVQIPRPVGGVADFTQCNNMLTTTTTMSPSHALSMFDKPCYIMVVILLFILPILVLN
ncbi:unnamed protein product, partial [Adineta ricciae]